MRILPIVCNEITYQPLIYETIIREKRSDIIGLVIVPFSTKQKSGISMLWFMLNLYGLKGFILKTIQIIYNNFLSYLSNFITLKRCYSLNSIAKKYNIPVFHVNNINSKEFLSLVESLQPDLIISSQGHFVGKRLLSIPKIGIINKHAGMLPKYRGIYPVFWAMLNDEKEIGVTVHFMNDYIDDGDIILQETINIADNDTFESIYRKVIQITPKLFIRAINLLEKGNLKLIPNDTSKATSFSFPSRKDIIRFKKAGKKII